MVQVTGFILIEFGHGRKGTGDASVIDDGAERLNGRGVCLEKGHFGVADRTDGASQQECSSSDTFSSL